MPKLKPETLEARREHILDAAERCFARAGFHRCTMADICAEAAISAGALYVHFESKEALIAGIVERNRARLADELAELAKAPDFTAALAALGEHYAVDEPQYKRILNLEIAAEATRNEKIAELFQACDRYVIDSFTELIERATREGRINPVGDARLMAQTICIIGEGMFWRRAVDPTFNGRELMGPVMLAVSALLNAPKSETSSDAQTGRDFPPDAKILEGQS